MKKFLSLFLAISAIASAQQMSIPAGNITAPGGISTQINTPNGLLIFNPGLFGVVPSTDNQVTLGSVTLRYSDVECTAIVLGGDGIHTGRPTISTTNAWPNQGIQFQGAGSGLISFASNSVPSTALVQSSGTGTFPWSGVFAQTFSIVGPTNTGVPTISFVGSGANVGIGFTAAGTGDFEFNAPVQINGRLNPLTDNTTDIGQITSTTWRTVYAYNLYARNGIQDAALTTQGPVSVNGSGVFSSAVWPLQCSLLLNPSQTIANATETNVSWTAADCNDVNMWSVSSPTLISMPSGVGTRVQLTTTIRWNTGSTGWGMVVKIKDNSGNIWAQYDGTASSPGGNLPSCTITTPVISLTANSISSFTVTVYQNSGGTLPLFNLDTRVSAEIPK